MREIVRVVMFLKGGEASLEGVRDFLKYNDAALPRTWRTQVRDVLKNGPEFERVEDDVYVLRGMEDVAA